MGRLEDDVRLPLLPQGDEQLEDFLAALREGAHVEVVHGQVRLGDPELDRRVAHLTGERVRREAGRERAGRDRERDVAHLAARLDEPGRGATATELAVVGVWSKDERTSTALDHVFPPFRGTLTARPTSPSIAQVIGSSKSAL